MADILGKDIPDHLVERQIIPDGPDGMRRHELRKLFEPAIEAGLIEPIDWDTPKDRLMPLLKTHIANGKVRLPSARDEQRIDVQELRNQIMAEIRREMFPPAERPVTEPVPEPEQTDEELPEPSIGELRSKAKRLGINTYKMKREDIIEAIAEKSASS